MTSQAVTGLVAHSKPNTAAYGRRGELLDGPPFLTPIEAGATFDLYNFFIGCTLSTQGTPVSAATGCTVVFKGYHGEKLAGTQTVSYQPSSTLAANMELVLVGKWATSLTNLTFETKSNLLIGTQVDK